MKKDKSPAHIVIKLLMNSMYDKTSVKPVETDTIFKDNKDDFDIYIYIYISYNYNYIDSVIEVNGIYDIKKKTNQFYHIIIIIIAVLKYCLCQNEL